MKRYKAIIVSDIHLGTEDSKAAEFLEFLSTHHTDILILNGDFIDGWAIAKGRRWRAKHTKVISKILDISRKVPVVWIRGNHDEFLHDFMHMHLGKLQVEEHYILDLGNGSRYFVFHGDVLDVFVAKWKWIAKLGATGYELALKINTLYNKWRAWRGLPYYSISKDIKAGVKAAVNYITDFEVSATKLARQHNCTGVICGHIHVPESRQIDGVHYLNSGDWVENMTAILIDHENTVEIKEFHRGLDKMGKL
jgi:UDP-2,3-diacylglucosamine pyrophosphatase LpxH